MAELAKFTDSDGGNSYTWEEWPDLPSDMPETTSAMHSENATLEHVRLGIITSRAVMSTQRRWTFIWPTITWSMVQSLQWFSSEDYFRFYHDNTQPDYANVYISNQLDPQLIRGGTYNLSMELTEI